MVSRKHGESPPLPERDGVRNARPPLLRNGGATTTGRKTISAGSFFSSALRGGNRAALRGARVLCALSFLFSGTPYGVPAFFQSPVLRNPRFGAKKEGGPRDALHGRRILPGVRAGRSAGAARGRRERSRSSLRPPARCAARCRRRDGRRSRSRTPCLPRRRSSGGGRSTASA